MAEDLDNNQRLATPSASTGGASGGQPQSTGPVGNGNYEVQQGDCIESIAHERGLFWRTIWNHTRNAELKSTRKDPNVLLPGDRLFLPEKQARQESGATEARHRFRRLGIPGRFRVRFLDEEGRPRAGESYVLTCEGRTHEGTLDSDGMLCVPIMPSAKQASVRIGEQDDYTIDLGAMDPASETSGMQARLANLGYACGSCDGALSPATEAAVRAFQQDHDLPVTGQLDEATRNRVRFLHDDQ